MQRRKLIKLTTLAYVLGNSPSTFANTMAAKATLEQILANGSAAFQRTLNRAKELQIQIQYSRRESGRDPGAWHRYEFGDTSSWFAPASLVKLPLAIFLLADLQRRGLDFRRVALAFPQMPNCAERASELRKPQTVSRIIERALVLSDDSAYCALYDYFGPEQINHWLTQYGFAVGAQGTRIQARFGLCGPENSMITGPVQIFQNGKLLVIEAKRQAYTLVQAPSPIRVGRAWISNGKLINGAKDFTNNNTMPLATIHQIMLHLVDPSSTAKPFALNTDARQFLLDCMARHPGDCGSCSATEKRQSRTDFRLLAVGDRQWRDGLQVRNKVGWAFGYLSDVAHLKFQQKECVVSCVMYLNADGLLNDGRYEYDSIGRPFMAELGRLLLDAS